MAENTAQNMKQYRDEIDRIDKTIQGAIQKRLEVVQKIGLEKRSQKIVTYNARREQEVSQSYQEALGKILRVNDAQSLAKTITSVSRNLQEHTRVFCVENDAQLGALACVTLLGVATPIVYCSRREEVVALLLSNENVLLVIEQGQALAPEEVLLDRVAVKSSVFNPNTQTIDLIEESWLLVEVNPL